MLKNKLYIACLVSTWAAPLLLLVSLFLLHDPYSEDKPIFVVVGVLIYSVWLLAFFTGLGVFIQACRASFKNIVYNLQLLSLIVSALIIIALLGSIMNGARVRIGQKKYGEYQLSIFYQNLFLYAEENNEFLPDAGQWYDLLLEHNPNLATKYFQLPQIYHQDDPAEYNVAMNKNISGMHLSQVHPETVLLFIAEGKWNLNGGQELLRGYVDDYMYSKVILKNGQIKEADRYDVKINLFRWEP